MCACEVGESLNMDADRVELCVLTSAATPLVFIGIATLLLLSPPLALLCYLGNIFSAWK